MRWCTSLRSKHIGVAALVGLLSGCTIPTDRDVPEAAAPTTTVVVVKPATSTAVPTSAEVTTSAAQSTAATLDVSDIVAAHGGRLGVAIVDGANVVTAGELTTGSAWSTMKVPVALAAARNGTASADLVRSAITSSDNAAAQSLWDSLGDPATAGQKTAAEIAAIAQAPQVNTVVTRPGFSSFGQTNWALKEQAQFGYQLACHPLAQTVVPGMGSIDAGQSYGLGMVGANFKGGWGPEPSGAYLVRQFGWVETPSGRVGVAIAAIAPDGSYGSGQAMLNEAAQRVQQFVSAKGMGSRPC